MLRQFFITYWRIYGILPYIFPKLQAFIKWLPVNKSGIRTYLFFIYKICCIFAFFLILLFFKHHFNFFLIF